MDPEPTPVAHGARVDPSYGPTLPAKGIARAHGCGLPQRGGFGRMARDTYRIAIDGDWSLADLYRFPRTYSQLYSFFYDAILRRDTIDLERLQHVFQAHPWLGGYSAVNFYNELGFSCHRLIGPELSQFAMNHPAGLNSSPRWCGGGDWQGRFSIHYRRRAVERTLLGYLQRSAGPEIDAHQVKREETAAQREEAQYLEESCQASRASLGLQGF